jgi:hypothetical protein
MQGLTILVKVSQYLAVAAGVVVAAAR